MTCTKQLTHIPTGMPFSYMKGKLEFMEGDKCKWKSTLIEGSNIVVAIFPHQGGADNQWQKRGESRLNLQLQAVAGRGGEGQDCQQGQQVCHCHLQGHRKAYLVATPKAYK
jgi:hypothetical protein